MKSLLAYLFIVLGLGLTFNVNAKTSSNEDIYKNQFIKKKVSWEIKVRPIHLNANIDKVFQVSKSYTLKKPEDAKKYFNKTVKKVLRLCENEKVKYKKGKSESNKEFGICAIYSIKYSEEKDLSKNQEFTDFNGINLENIIVDFRGFQTEDLITTESKIVKAIELNESNRNLDKLKRIIINDPEFFKKTKYFSRIITKGIDKNGKKISSSILAVYLNYEEVLQSLTENPEIKSIGQFAWGFEFSNKELNGLTKNFTGQKAIKSCYKDAKKKKLKDGECIFVDFRKYLGHWNTGVGENYLYKERSKRIILKTNKFDESDAILKKLYRTIMSDQNFIKKSNYLKYSKTGSYNKSKIETMALAVYINYEKEVLNLMLHPLLLDVEVSAWGWEFFTIDNSDRFMRFMASQAIRKCNRAAFKKKLHGGECIIIDFRKLTVNSQVPTLVKNYLFEERENREIIAKFLNQGENTKIKKIAENKIKEEKQQKLLAENKIKEEKQQKLLAENKIKEEKQQKLLAENKIKEEKQQKLLAENKIKEEKQQKLLAENKIKEEKQQKLLAENKIKEEKQQKLLAENKIKEEKQQKLLAENKIKEEKFAEIKKNQDIDDQGPEILVAEKISTNTQVYKLEGSIKDKSEFIFEIDGQPLKVDEKGNFTFEGFIIDEKEGVVLNLVAIDRWNNISEKTVVIDVEIEKTKISRSYEKLIPNRIKVKKNDNRVALIIGIEKYENLKNLDAVYANRDAKAFGVYANITLGIPKKNIKLLVDEDATRSDTLKALKLWLPQKTKGSKKDIFIFFAGHGLASDDGKDLYVLPQDGDSILLEDTAILRSDIIKQIQKLNPNSVTMFFDTCYSGQTRKEETLIAGLRPVRIVVDEQETPNNFTIFTASNYDQTSGSINEAEHGIFSYYLMKGLEGNADINKDKKLTNGELIAYLKNNVSQEAFTKNRQQDPMLAGDPDKVLLRY